MRSKTTTTEMTTKIPSQTLGLKNVTLIVLCLFSLFIPSRTLRAQENSINQKTRLLIVSDIDDTIKRTYVLAEGYWRWKFFWNGAKSRNYYSGMATLYRELTCQELPLKRSQSKTDQKMLLKSCATFSLATPVSTTASSPSPPKSKAPVENKSGDTAENDGTSDHEGHTITYVSGVPGVLQVFAKNFLRNSNFPQGDLYGRPNRSVETKGFKIATIKKLVKRYNPQHLLLVGDNGQWDASAYAAIQKWAPENTSVHAYIRQVYPEPTGQPLEESQKGFISAGDIALDLYRQGHLERTSAQKVIDEVLNDADKNLEKVFPSFSDCSTYNLPGFTQKQPEAISENELYQLYRFHCQNK